MASRVRKGTLSQEKFGRTISLLKGVLDYENFKDVDMVIEAVPESISLKQDIFSDLENPAHVMPLVEIVRTSKTSRQIDKAMTKFRMRMGPFRY
ncbi:hypothetical protein Tsubulata_001897 [Turnera subulata]|uniref:3-hydroxyacyl-CoA dehydrogenase NAD binding domain-containing protein n=1 Tax=Turnera subulata TaxID=218843 RepID=A0A9Q0J050_9ROSI|nr:hypothetical protein Tsubulata_001897 [Turnera subulata]